MNGAAAPACIIGYSGMFVGAAALTTDAVRKPPVLLVHGAADSVVPVGALVTAKADLLKLGIAAETHISPGVGHTVDLAGITLGGAFAVKHLPA